MGTLDDPWNVLKKGTLMKFKEPTHARKNVTVQNFKLLNNSLQYSLIVVKDIFINLKIFHLKKNKGLRCNALQKLLLQMKYLKAGCRKLKKIPAGVSRASDLVRPCSLRPDDAPSKFTRLLPDS